jgi:hypothetical protein
MERQGVAFLFLVEKEVGEEVTVRKGNLHLRWPSVKSRNKKAGLRRAYSGDLGLEKTATKKC